MADPYLSARRGVIGQLETYRSISARSLPICFCCVANTLTRAAPTRCSGRGKPTAAASWNGRSRSALAVCGVTSLCPPPCASASCSTCAFTTCSTPTSRCSQPGSSSTKSVDGPCPRFSNGRHLRPHVPVRLQRARRAVREVPIGGITDYGSPDKYPSRGGCNDERESATSTNRHVRSPRRGVENARRFAGLFASGAGWNDKLTSTVEDFRRQAEACRYLAPEARASQN